MYSKSEEKALFDDTKAFLNGRQLKPGDSLEALHAELVKLINYHEWKYYVQNDPVITDFEYDQLYQELQKLETEHPHLVSPSSPTQRVSSDLNSDFSTVRHLTPMLSLANSYDATDLTEFNTSVRKILAIGDQAPIDYLVEPKFDGGSIALLYEDDQLIRAATRGNGQEGDDITANVRTLRSIPLQARFSKFGIRRIELRGEAIIRKDQFAVINQRRADEGLFLFANARNAATGGLRMKNPSDTAQRGIEAFIYQISYLERLDLQSAEDVIKGQWEGIGLLDQLGFKVPIIESKLCRDMEEVITFCQSWEEKRDSYPYEIDGMVVKVDRIEYQRKIGSTSHHPRWAIAYKFKARQATSTLRNVEYQVGKIGSITPVAKIDPVQLAGVTVTSVSLHNEDFITSKDLHLGDTVVVERAGDVIPHIVKALPELRDGSEEQIRFPTTCPINKEEAIPLVRMEDESAWRCPTCTCGAQDLQRIIFHVSKPAMNIDGFGRSIVERFYDLGWLNSIADVYRLDYEKIESLDGFGQRSATKLRRSIERAKKNPINRLLHSLSIHHLGKRASKILAQQVSHVLDLQHWSKEDYMSIKDIGPVLAKNMVDYFHNPKQVALLKELEALGVNMRQTEEDRPLEVARDAILSGLTILFTGTLGQMSRKEAQILAEKHGARNVSSVSANLDVLVVGERAGSKLKKARDLGTVEIWTEDEFLSKLAVPKE